MIEQLVVGPLETNCWIVPLPSEGMRRKHCLIVDPGGDASAIIARLEALGTKPSIVVITHGHFDHLQGLGELVEHYRREDWPLDIAIHSSEACRTGRNAERIHRADFARIGAAGFIAQYWHDIPEATRLVNDGDRLYLFEVLHVPGHSPGSIALYSAKEKLLVSGDCLFRHAVGRTDLPGGDAFSQRASLSRLLALPPKTLVLPGHGDTTTIARERDWIKLPGR